jgi:acetolactate synthase-1/2/3 large subunit
MSNAATAAQRLAAALARHEVTTVFGQSLPSAAILAAEDIGIRQFVYRTENAGAAMADGYARISGRVAVVTAQNGPAATLLVPGLAEALKSSVPIVALVQDVVRNTADRNAFQELDHLALFQACAKWVRRVGEANRIEDYVDMAFAAAASGRPGPAVLLLPADMLNERMVEETQNRAAKLGRYPLDRTCADAARIEEAATLLRAARRPIVVAGGGVHLSGAAPELARLQALGFPVMTTVMGKGSVDERHPLSLGVTGNVMGRLAPAHHLKEMMDAADLLLLVGTRTAQNGTDSWTLYPRKAHYIHIDIDGQEIGRNYEALRLVGDAQLILSALIARLDENRDRASTLAQQIEAGRARHATDIAPLLQSMASPLRPERLMQDLQSLLTPETIVVGDASYATVWIAAYLRALAPGMRFLTPRGLAGLGWGLPMALGAKAAKPTSPVVCLVGDGGFGHVWSELETARRMGMAVTVIVLNNGVLGFQKDAEDVKFGRHTSAIRFAPVDHAQIARACGCRGVAVNHVEEFLPALREALAADTATVLDVLTDPQAYPPLTLFDDRLEAVRRDAAQR